MRSGRPGAGVAGKDGCIYRPCPCLLPHLRRSSYCMQVKLHTCVETYGFAHWGEIKGLLPGLHHRRCGCWGLLCSTALWPCCGGGAVTVAAFRYNMCACFMTHSFLTWVFIPYDDVYITIDVYIFIRKILWSCTVAFLLMSVSFTIYLVRDDLIYKWNQWFSFVSKLK